MLKRLFFISTVAVLLASCSLFSNKPDNLIDKEKLVDVLVDVHMADAVVAVKGLRINRDSVLISLYYDDVMKKHNITRKQFDITIEYYSKHAEKYDKIYDEVLEILSKKQKQFLESKKPKAKKPTKQ